MKLIKYTKDELLHVIYSVHYIKESNFIYCANGILQYINFALLVHFWADVKIKTCKKCLFCVQVLVRWL